MMEKTDIQPKPLENNQMDSIDDELYIRNHDITSKQYYLVQKRVLGAVQLQNKRT